ncbi:hypothetical protein GCM10017562_75440 [Streptomyces roseofulvus]
MSTPQAPNSSSDGPLPDWDAEEEEIDRRVTQLEAINKHVTGEMVGPPCGPLAYPARARLCIRAIPSMAR